MVERSKKLLSPLKEFDNVLVGVSQSNKCRGDPRNLIEVVLNINDETYKVGTKYGLLDNILNRNSLNKTKYNRLKIIDVPQTETSIRTLANLGSVNYITCLAHLIHNCAFRISLSSRILTI